MSLYRVSYQSMTAFYGPVLIEADNEEEARRRFGRGAFNGGERTLIRAVPVSDSDLRREVEK